ncbi:hypothetical protein ACM5Q9_08395 [Advenella sp. RU8]
MQNIVATAGAESFTGAGGATQGAYAGQGTADAVDQSSGMVGKPA